MLDNHKKTTLGSLQSKKGSYQMERAKTADASKVPKKLPPINAASSSTGFQGLQMMAGKFPSNGDKSGTASNGAKKFLLQVGDSPRGVKARKGNSVTRFPSRGSIKSDLFKMPSVKPESTKSRSLKPQSPKNVAADNVSVKRRSSDPLPELRDDKCGDKSPPRKKSAVEKPVTTDMSEKDAASEKKYGPEEKENSTVEKKKSNEKVAEKSDSKKKSDSDTKDSAVKDDKTPEKKTSEGKADSIAKLAKTEKNPDSETRKAKRVDVDAKKTDSETKKAKKADFDAKKTDNETKTPSSKNSRTVERKLSTVSDSALNKATKSDSAINKTSEKFNGKLTTESVILKAKRVAAQDAPAKNKSAAAKDVKDVSATKIFSDAETKTTATQRRDSATKKNTTTEIETATKDSPNDSLNKGKDSPNDSLNKAPTSSEDKAKLQPKGERISLLDRSARKTDEFVACRHCLRTFAPARIEAHQNVCKNLQNINNELIPKKKKLKPGQAGYDRKKNSI